MKLCLLFKSKFEKALNATNAIISNNISTSIRSPFVGFLLKNVLCESLWLNPPEAVDLTAKQ